MRLTLEEALSSYQSSVYKAAFYICRNREDAEDAAQDTFLAYHREPKEFESRDHIRAWLLRTAVNKARNTATSLWRRNRIDLPDFTEWAGEIPDPSGRRDGPDPADLVRQVMALPEKCRMTIHLFYYEDYSVKDIAGVLGISENTVKSQLHRGRELLKKRLGEEWQDD